MPENGYAKLVIRILAGIVVTGIISILTITGTNVIANDRASRDRDEKIAAESRISDDKMDDENKMLWRGQQVINQQLSNGLIKISTDIEYIKKQVDK